MAGQYGWLVNEILREERQARERAHSSVAPPPAATQPPMPPVNISVTITVGGVAYDLVPATASQSAQARL
jgi:hypothetical protein